MTMRAVLASKNAHKLEELQRILGEQLPELELLPYDGEAPIDAETARALAATAMDEPA